MPANSCALNTACPRTVTLVAPGLIGGSLALALKKQGNWEVRVWVRDQASLRRVEKILQPARVSLRFEEVIPGAKIVVLCTPVSAMGRLARQINPLLDQDAVVTDVGSVKTPVMCELVPIFQDRFVGAHPMTGSERSGVEAACERLFEGAVCILTPLASPQACLQTVRNIWAAVGARTVEMDPEAHDAAVALISHLPHAAAVALVRTVCSQNFALQKFAGGGYRDTTRIAQGAPDLWVDIFLQNRESLLKAIADYMNELNILSDLLQRDDSNGLKVFLKEAQQFRALI